MSLFPTQPCLGQSFLLSSKTNSWGSCPLDSEKGYSWRQLSFTEPTAGQSSTWRKLVTYWELSQDPKTPLSLKNDPMKVSKR